MIFHKTRKKSEVYAKPTSYLCILVCIACIIVFPQRIPAANVTL